MSAYLVHNYTVHGKARHGPKQGLRQLNKHQNLYRVVRVALPRAEIAVFRVYEPEGFVDESKAELF